MSGIDPGVSCPSELDSLLVIADSGQRCWFSVGLEQAHPISTATGMYFPKKTCCKMAHTPPQGPDWYMDNITNGIETMPEIDQPALE